MRRASSSRPPALHGVGLALGFGAGALAARQSRARFGASTAVAGLFARASLRVGAMIPGEIFPRRRDHAQRRPRGDHASAVANTGDRPIQVGSHYHFAETNARARLRPRRRPRPPPRHPRRDRRPLRARPDPRGAAHRPTPATAGSSASTPRSWETSNDRRTPQRVLPVRRRRLRGRRRHLRARHLQLLALPAARLRARLRAASAASRSLRRRRTR